MGQSHNSGSIKVLQNTTQSGDDPKIALRNPSQCYVVTSKLLLLLLLLLKIQASRLVAFRYVNIFIIKEKYCVFGGVLVSINYILLSYKPNFRVVHLCALFF